MLAAAQSLHRGLARRAEGAGARARPLLSARARSRGPEHQWQAEPYNFTGPLADAGLPNPQPANRPPVVLRPAAARGGQWRRQCRLRFRALPTGPGPARGSGGRAPEGGATMVGNRALLIGDISPLSSSRSRPSQAGWKPAWRRRQLRLFGERRPRRPREGSGRGHDQPFHPSAHRRHGTPVFSGGGQTANPSCRLLGRSRRRPADGAHQERTRIWQTDEARWSSSRATGSTRAAASL